MDALLDARSALHTLSSHTADAADSLGCASMTLESALGGETALVARMLLDQAKTTDGTLSEVSGRLSMAIAAYVDSVNAIKRQSAPIICDRDYALHRLAVSFLDDPQNPPADTELARRTRFWDDARKDLHVAEAALDSLALARNDADGTFVAKTGQVLSAAWSDARTTRETQAIISRDLRNDANAEVWKLFAEFKDGAGNHRLLLDGDPFVEMLKVSGHLSEVRARLTDLLVAGVLNEGSTAAADRLLGGQLTTFFLDGANILTGGTAGSLPESYLGSYELRYRVDSVEGVNAVVTFTVHNTTSIESFARNPLDPAGGQIPGFYDHLKNLRDDRGMYQPTEQTIVWTETIGQS